MAKIDDLVLRSGLAGIKSKFKDALEEELVARQVHNVFAVPLLIEDTELRALYQDDIDYVQILYSLSTDAEIPSKEAFKYPNSKKLRNAIAETHSWHRSAHQEMSELLIDIEALVAQLQKEVQ